MISSSFCNSASIVSPTGTPCPAPWLKRLVRVFCLHRPRRPHFLSSKERRRPMPKPDLQHLIQWLDPALVSRLETKRLLKKECQRHRKLATLETLWLILAVSLDTQRSSLYEILRLTTGKLNLQWSISVAAFCKARARFSPGGSILGLWPFGFPSAKCL
jgi:hypothetical protein